MNKFLITGLLFLSMLAVQAQDTLHMLDGSVREGTIVEVTEQHIRYIPANDPEDRIFTILREAVEKITYADGTVHYLHTPELPPHPPELSTPTEEEMADQFAAANHLSFSLICISYRGRMTLAYERLFKSGEIGIEIPFSVGVFDLNMYSFYGGRLVFSSGLAINSYKQKRENLKTFMGFGVFAGSHKYEPGLPDSNTNQTAKLFGADVYYGLSIQRNKRFGLSGQVGIGIGKTDAYRSYLFRVPLDISVLVSF